MIEIEGIRTNLTTGEECKVKLQAEVITLPNGEKVFQLYGGPTGYESFYITPQTYEDFKPDKNYWEACFGDRRWDRLIIYASEMRKVLGE